jgi:hypothetical protein
VNEEGLSPVSPRVVLETVLDWNGRKIPVARSRIGTLVTARVEDNLVRGDVEPWMPPELVQKAYQGRAKFDEASEALAAAGWPYYCDLQSINSEDAVTWSVFGPLIYATPRARTDVASALLACIGVHDPQHGPAHVWLWRRIPHPDTRVSGGPEIDVGIHIGDTLILGEAKWGSALGAGQGVAGDQTQVDLRRRFCQDDGAWIYPNVNRFVVLGIAEEPDLIPYSDSTCSSDRADRVVLLRSVTWDQLSAIPALPHGEEVRRYLAWKRTLARRALASP